MSVRFVKGGSDEARLTPIGGRVKQRVSLSDRQRQALYRQYLMGEKVSDLAQSYNIGTSTVYAYINGERQKEGKMAFTEKVIDGDKRNGRLLYVNSAKHKFEGTHLTSDGEMHRLKFTANNSTIARQKWRKWCEELDAEIEFMNMVERKEPEKPEVVCGYPLDPIEEIRPTKQDEPPTDEEVYETQDEIDVTPAPVPEIQVRPWKEVAEEREKRIAELEACVAQLEDKERMLSVSDQVISDSEGEVPKLAHWFNSNGAFKVFWLDKPVYVLWARSDSPKLYGVYCSMESALAEVDRLNDVAKFLGQGSVFEVEEVAWRG